MRGEYGWGPRKLQTLLRRLGVSPLPARSTIALILQREGLSARRGRRPRAQTLRSARTAMSGPNVVWTADFKGEFRTRDGAWCYPLTVMDGFSRYLLACAVVPGPQTGVTQHVFTRVFREYGLPQVLRTDKRGAVCESNDGRPLVAAVGVVDPLGHYGRTHRSGLSRPERAS